MAGQRKRYSAELKTKVALEAIGADGRQLLERVYAETNLPWLRDLHARHLRCMKPVSSLHRVISKQRR